MADEVPIELVWLTHSLSVLDPAVGRQAAVRHPDQPPVPPSLALPCLSSSTRVAPPCPLPLRPLPLLHLALALPPALRPHPPLSKSRAQGLVRQKCQAGRSAGRLWGGGQGEV